MYSIKIWRNSNKTYITSQPRQGVERIHTELTHTLLDIAIQKINANKWVYYIFKTNNYLYIKELEAAVNRRNKLNRLMELKDV